MWEFLSRKKEIPVVPMTEASVVDAPASTETAPRVEASSEHVEEGANEQYSAILTQSSDTNGVVPVPAAVDDDAAQMGRLTDAGSRVNQLVELAQVKGVAHAVAVARKLNDLYVLDTMRDELADKLYDALKAKGLIQGE